MEAGWKSRPVEACVSLHKSFSSGGVAEGSESTHECAGRSLRRLGRVGGSAKLLCLLPAGAPHHWSPACKGPEEQIGETSVCSKGHSVFTGSLRYLLVRAKKKKKKSPLSSCCLDSHHWMAPDLTHWTWVAKAAYFTGPVSTNPLNRRLDWDVHPESQVQQLHRLNSEMCSLKWKFPWRCPPTWIHFNFVLCC